LGWTCLSRAIGENIGEFMSAGDIEVLQLKPFNKIPFINFFIFFRNTFCSLKGPGHEIEFKYVDKNLQF
jgi:hypothetical protein